MLPSIRKTGQYTSSKSRATAGSETIQVFLPNFGRFVVTNTPGRPPHIHQSEFNDSLESYKMADVMLLAQSLKLIEGLWHKVQQMRAIGQDTTGGFHQVHLEQALVLSGRLAKQFMYSYEAPKD